MVAGNLDVGRGILDIVGEGMGSGFSFRGVIGLFFLVSFWVGWFLGYSEFDYFYR